jgi:hypothetical protein
MNNHIVVGYEIRYENGSSHMLHAGLSSSLQDAIEVSEKSLLGCLPKDFKPDNLVRPVIARRLDVCGICGQASKKLKLVFVEIGAHCPLCYTCISEIKRM